MNPPTHTTLAALAAHNPCKPGRDRLLAGLGKTEADDEPLALVKVLEICGLQDALWCIDHVWHDKLRMRLACRFAREVAHLMPQGSRDALEVVERYAEGGASETVFKEATDAARAASTIAARMAYAYTATATAAAAAAAARAAYTAAEARASGAATEATEAAYAAAEARASGAATEATEAAYAAAPGSGSRATARAKQTQILREFLTQMEGGAA